MDNIVMSATPHVRSKESVQSIMRDVIIALIPATVMGIKFFGIKALMLTVISVVSSVFFEWLYEKILKKPCTIHDLSAVVTGMLIAFNMPVGASWWMPIVGAAFAIIIAKQLFGGIGQNFVNPALMARAFLLASYPSAMTTWSVDGVTTATPLALLKTLKNSGVTLDSLNLPSLAQVATGVGIGGCIGETCAIALLIGFVYLLIRKVISWRIPVIYIATVFILSTIIGRYGVRMGYYEIFCGGLFLGAIFMATDYTTSPMTPKGQIIYAIGCGVLTYLIRVYGSYPEGVSYSILIMNLGVPLIDKYVVGKIFGALPKVKEAKKA
ncbi:MAG: RnfABCDGE type electron transport complex subunit D [Clostridia bacterium]|jgi:electron transport complex protein RnfD|nr:RnfABCDGE type electron transport complex subunit D [Clostridia bacterium]MCI2001134.1 RnfABCDGE type electron transport complex subunit D [Clostridia bacterium]MCI2015824.1 RnfABCDGE type electron transport complex subunit D [Clostridia bacterium]